MPIFEHRKIEANQYSAVNIYYKMLLNQWQMSLASGH